MKRIICTILLAGCLLASASAQDTADFYNAEEAKKAEPKPPYKIKDHLFTGGNFGLQFGTITLIDVAPVLGYKITPRFSVAVGVNYTFYKDSRPPAFTQNIYGGRVFGRYFIFDNLFVHAEYEGLNSQWDYYKKPFTIYSFLAGVGYRQAVAERLFLDAMLLYNFNTGYYQLYNNPIIRIGFNVGL